MVTLLAELEKLIFDTHQMVFSGGTALAKSNVKILRMSEDVDIKLIPTEIFQLLSLSKKKTSRKALVEHIEAAIIQSSYFTIEKAGSG